MTESDSDMDTIAYVGGLLNSICLLPQIYRIYKTKSVYDISIYWQLLLLCGTSLIIIYTYSKNIIPLMITETIEIFFIVVLLIMKFHYSKRLYINSETTNATNNSSERRSLSSLRSLSSISSFDSSNSNSNSYSRRRQILETHI